MGVDNKLRSSILNFVLNRAFILVIGIVLFFNLFIGFGVDIINDAIAPLPVCDEKKSSSEVDVSTEVEEKDNLHDKCLSEREDALNTRETTSFFFKVVSGAVVVVSGLMHIRRRLLGVSFIASGLVSILIGVLNSDLGGFEFFIVTGCILIVLILLALRSVSSK